MSPLPPVTLFRFDGMLIAARSADQARTWVVTMGFGPPRKLDRIAPVSDEQMDEVRPWLRSEWSDEPWFAWLFKTLPPDRKTEASYREAVGAAVLQEPEIPFLFSLFE